MDRPGIKPPKKCLQKKPSRTMMFLAICLGFVLNKKKNNICNKLPKETTTSETSIFAQKQRQKFKNITTSIKEEDDHDEQNIVKCNNNNNNMISIDNHFNKNNMSLPIMMNHNHYDSQHQQQHNISFNNFQNDDDYDDDDNMIFDNDTKMIINRNNNNSSSTSLTTIKNNGHQQQVLHQSSPIIIQMNDHSNDYHKMIDENEDVDEEVVEDDDDDDDNRIDNLYHSRSSLSSHHYQEQDHQVFMDFHMDNNEIQNDHDLDASISLESKAETSEIIKTLKDVNFKKPKKHTKLQRQQKKSFIIPETLCQRKSQTKLNKSKIEHDNHHQPLMMISNIPSVSNNQCKQQNHYYYHHHHRNNLSTLSSPFHQAYHEYMNMKRKHKLLELWFEMKFITDRLRHEDEVKEVVAEWRYGAIVLDRCCLILFSFLTIGSLAIFLYCAPQLLV